MLPHFFNINLKLLSKAQYKESYITNWKGSKEWVFMPKNHADRKFMFISDQVTNFWNHSKKKKKVNQFFNRSDKAYELNY